MVLAWLTKIGVEDRVRLSALLAGQWDGKLGAGYPGAAVLAGQVTNVKAKPVLPPLNDLRADVPKYWQQGCLDGGNNPAEGMRLR